MDGLVIHSAPLARFGQAHLFAAHGYEPRAAPVPRLLFSGCPHTITGRISAVIVYSFKRVKSARTRPNVGEESREVIPCRRKRDAAPAIMTVSGITRIAATSADMKPRPIFRGAVRPALRRAVRRCHLDFIRSRFLRRPFPFQALSQPEPRRASSLYREPCAVQTAPSIARELRPLA